MFTMEEWPTAVKADRPEGLLRKLAARATSLSFTAVHLYSSDHVLAARSQRVSPPAQTGTGLRRSGSRLSPPLLRALPSLVWSHGGDAVGSPRSTGTERRLSVVPQSAGRGPWRRVLGRIAALFHIKRRNNFLSLRRSGKSGR